MHHKTGILFLHLPQDSKGVVTAAVVDNNHLDVGEGLA